MAADRLRCRSSAARWLQTCVGIRRPVTCLMEIYSQRRPSDDGGGRKGGDSRGRKGGVNWILLVSLYNKESCGVSNGLPN